MAGVDTKISALPERAIVDGTEHVPVRVGNFNYKVLISKILVWIKTQLTDYVTLTGTQTLTDKTLTNPSINGVAVTVTGTVINFLSGLNANVKTLIENLLSADTAIRGRLTALESSITPKTYSELSTFPTGWIKTIEASTIERSLNIDWKSVIVQFYQKSSFNQAYIMQDVSSCVNMNYYGDNLISVTFDISSRTLPAPTTIFLFVISYKTIRGGGGGEEY